MGVRVFAMTKPEGLIGQAVGAENCIRMASNHGAGGCEKDYYLADTAEYAIPGLEADFRVIVSPWILSSLVTDRMAAYYETVTKHNLTYRRYYHQFDY